MKAKKNEIVEVDNGYLALQNFDIKNAIASEMEGLDAAFDVIKMPSGGVTMFEMPTDNPEETESVKEFSAVILHHHPLRAYYKEEYTGGNNPPDCGSVDGVHGVGEPSGDCAVCVYNDFGTGKNGSKACKERRRLYLLLEGEVFPKILSLPTSSLKPFSRYLMRCLPKWGRSSGGVTKFTLTKATNNGGIAYAKAQFQMERRLTEPELEQIEKLIDEVKVIAQVAMETSSTSSKLVTMTDSEAEMSVSA